MKTIATAVIAGALAASLHAQTAQEETTAEVFTAPSGEILRYRQHLPKNVAAGKKLPLVLFLHGAGERGTNNVSQLKHGVSALLQHGAKANDPAVLLAPQCPSGMQWVNVPWSAPSHTMPEQPSDSMRLALALLREKLATLPIDPDRVYVTGVSMGGYGTWDAIQREPSLFAAAIPICGGGDIRRVQGIRRMPIWVFHGRDDKNVPVDCSRRMVTALKQLGSRAVRYTEYEGAEHNVWDRTYENAEVVEGLLRQRRAGRPWWQFWK
jgi:predicted peptidase